MIYQKNSINSLLKKRKFMIKYLINWSTLIIHNNSKSFFNAFRFLKTNFPNKEKFNELKTENEELEEKNKEYLEELIVII